MKPKLSKVLYIPGQGEKRVSMIKSLQPPKTAKKQLDEIKQVNS